MSQSDVDRIKAKLSIVDVVSPYVDLKPAGSRLKGLSPFTREKTPSFFVSPEQGFYHCFSTDQGGDMFSFIQAIEGLDFVGALRFLADKAGIELTNTRSSDSADKRAIYDALERATEFFQAAYKVATAAQHFVAGRGINSDEVARFRIGYAPDDWRRLHEALKSDFSDEVLEKAGLIKHKGGSTYDVFRDRVMFPIRDIAGRVVGFSGRRLDGEKMAKYLNSPEGPVFKKSQVLYGLFEGRNSIRQLDFVTLVEGQIDLVMAHQAGSRNTVASSGTAFTPNHLQIIKRYSENILLAFDSDSAGIKASIKVAEAAYREGMVVKAIDLPADSDPADMISNDPQDWVSAIKSAQLFPALLTKKSKILSRNDTNFKQTLSKVIVPLLSLIESPIQREDEIALVAKEAGIAADIIAKEIEHFLSKKTSSNTSTTATFDTSANPHPETNQTTNSKQEILQAIADKIHLMNHYFPDHLVPDHSMITEDLPAPSTKNVLSRNVKDFSQLRREFETLIRDYMLHQAAADFHRQIQELEKKSPKTADDLNELIRLKKLIEDLPEKTI